MGEQCFDDLHCLKFDDIVPRFIETEYPGPTQYEPINAALDRYNVGLRQKPLPGMAQFFNTKTKQNNLKTSRF